MTKNVPSENILKLRELTKMMADQPNNTYEVVVRKLKKVVDDGKKTVNESLSPQNKIKCYEEMCMVITNILNNVKI